jgi:hypothetical protein
MTVAIPVIDYLDLATKHIYLLPGVREYHPVEDIYVEIRNIRRLDETMRVFDMPVKAYGAVSKGGGKYTPRYAMFNFGWTIVPENVSHSLFISGEQITDDGQSGPACIDTSVLTSAVIIQYEPPAAEIIRDVAALEAIGHMAFFNAVTIDSVNGGIDSDVVGFGTAKYPCKYLADALVVALDEGITQFNIVDDLIIDAGDFSHGYAFIGRSAISVNIHILAAPNVENCDFQTSTIDGYLDGSSVFRECIMRAVAYISGYIYNCSITGPITLSGNLLSAPACRISPEQAISVGYVVFDYEGTTGGGAILPEWGGGLISIENMVTGCFLGIGGTSGQTRVEASCTGGMLSRGGAVGFGGLFGILDVDDDQTTATQSAGAVWTYERP